MRSRDIKIEVSSHFKEKTALKSGKVISTLKFCRQKFCRLIKIIEIIILIESLICDKTLPPLTFKFNSYHALIFLSCRQITRRYTDVDASNSFSNQNLIKCSLGHLNSNKSFLPQSHNLIFSIRLSMIRPLAFLQFTPKHFSRSRHV